MPGTSMFTPHGLNVCRANSCGQRSRLKKTLERPHWLLVTYSSRSTPSKDGLKSFHKPPDPCEPVARHNYVTRSVKSNAGREPTVVKCRRRRVFDPNGATTGPTAVHQTRSE